MPMKCPSCQHDNPPTAKFCQECGAPQVRVCRQCGSALPDKAKFCPECACPVDGLPATPARAAQPEGERRQATVLFADISGYTQLCASTDAEHVQALLDRFYASMDGTVAAYGGKVIDHAGDGVLAVFGAPVAHGNDTERALRAALDMHAAAALLSDPAGRPLKLHIGIASGEVVASVLSGGATPKYTVTGDTVNLAARLCALAEGGDTVLSASVLRSVAALVDAEDLGERALKGVAAPTRVYRVRTLRLGAVDRLPFIGRDTELRQLSGVLDGLRERSTGVALAIRGDPGIGKSRLVEELRWRAGGQGVVCHVARVLDFGVGKAQEALPAIVTDLLGATAGEAEAARRSRLDQAMAAGLVAPEHETLIAELLGVAQRAELQSIYDAMDNATRVRRTADAVASLAAKAARERPRVIVFDDIHWGSPILMACLAALTIATREAPMVLVMTTRFEADPLDRSWRAASRGTPLLTIDVGPLRPDEARRLAGEMIQSSARFVGQCIERAEGNPLFLEQLLRNARESDSGQIPPTIQSLVLARMDRLPPRDKLALQAASVIGKRFTLDTLRFLIGDAAYRCNELVATDLVRPEGDDFLFAHALIQEGVYSSLLNARKRELHGRAAQWYREHREAALHAEHLDRAEDAHAAQAYLDAAQDESKRFRYDSALRMATRGFALAKNVDLRFELAMRRGELLRELASTDESISAFEQALHEAASDEQRCRAWYGLAASYRVTGDLEQALQCLDLAQPIADRSGLWSQCSRIHSLRGNLYFAQGNVAGCGREHALALEHARRANDLECEALAWSGLGDHSYAEGRMRTALGHFRRCIEVYRQAGLMRSQIVNLCMVGHCLDWTGQGDSGLEVVREAVELSERIGVSQTHVVTLESYAFMLLNRGLLAQAEPWIEKATEAARKASARRYLSIDLLMMSVCRHAQGRTAEARALVQDAFELAKQTGTGFLGPSLLAAIARYEEDPQQRKRWLQDGEAMVHAGCLAHASLMYYRDAIDISLSDREWDEALRYADALEAMCREEPLAFATLIAGRARALVALEREGPRPEVIAELERLSRMSWETRIGSLTPKIADVLASLSAKAAPERVSPPSAA
jgi:class 3 adenylate cyclase/tetratricopeptide (TPR) repeat protein